MQQFRLAASVLQAEGTSVRLGGRVAEMWCFEFGDFVLKILSLKHFCILPGLLPKIGIKAKNFR